MRKMAQCGILIALIFSMLMHPVQVWSWCWIRDTSFNDCGSGTYQQNCCSGNLRIWNNAEMTYQISTSTSSSLHTDIENGFNRWTNVTMSTFVFTRGTDTSAWDYSYDGTNVVNIDESFCTHFPSNCGQGILGFSGTWTIGSGVNYQAVESDIILNGEEFSWGDGSPGTIDTEGVIVHEAGHNTGLTHAGSTCRSAGSSGCGSEFPSATMYYSYSGGQPTNKASPELDDVACLVYGYPRSTFRVQVLDNKGNPVSGAEVELIGTAVPVNGADIATGGTVYGDISGSLMGDGVSSPTYVSSTPFTNTDEDGYTNYISPVHQSFRVRVNQSGKIVTKPVTLSDGTSTVIVNMAQTLQGPYLLLFN